MDTTDPLTQVSPDEVFNPDPLSQLADIRLPQEVGLWPLAPGWWVLIVLALALMVLAIILLRKSLFRQRVRGFALNELALCLQRRQQAETKGLDMNEANLDYINNVNAVLRRVALAHHPHERVASLNGEAWLAFLREHGDASLLDERNARALAHGRFAPRCDIDAETLNDMAEQWINSLYAADIKAQDTTRTATEHA
jgi:hypothetical protein